LGCVTEERDKKTILISLFNYGQLFNFKNNLLGENMKTTICHFFILFIITIVSTFSYGQKSVLELNLEPGQYAVGFKTVSQYDYSRSFSKHDAEGNLVNESGARPIQTSIWYPAEKQEESTMLFEEYTYSCCK